MTTKITNFAGLKVIKKKLLTTKEVILEKF